MAIIEKAKNFIRYRAYKEVFSTPESKKVLADMCRAHHVFEGGFDPDPYEHARQAGERNVVLRILTIVNLTHEEVIELSKEE